MIVLDANVFVSWSRDPFWNSLRRVNDTIEGIQSQFIVLQNELSQFINERYQRSIFATLAIEGYWADYYQRLLWRVTQLHVDRREIARADALAATDILQACKYLSNAIHKAFFAKMSRLRRSLRALRGLRVLLLRFAARQHELHDQITLQRRFYLTHGAHPIEGPIDLGRTNDWGGGYRP